MGLATESHKRHKKIRLHDSDRSEGSHLLDELPPFATAFLLCILCPLVAIHSRF